MEDKADVSLGVVERDQTNVSKAFESRREMWKHMMKGGAVKTQRDYTKYNVFLRPWVAALDRNGDAIWNYGMRTPFLAADKMVNVIRTRVLGSSAGK